MSEEPRKTPLFERHRSEGGRIVPFAGYALPIEYTGILDEHRAVRRSAGLFDVSHMGQVRLRGRDATRLAQRLFTNDLGATAPGRVRYGMFCREDGGVLDDVTAYPIAPDELLFCVNAATRAADVEWILHVRERDAFDCEVRDESDDTALLAVQGPAAVEIVHRALGDSGRPPGRWAFRTARFAGSEIWLSRTGYTGEDGYEIYLPGAHALELWDALRKTGGERLQPAGLGCRDTLRTEMGFALYGHELSPAIHPLEAGLERFVAFGNGFIGEPALREIRAQGGPARRLVGLVLETRSVARPETSIYAPLGDSPPDKSADPLGIVTSGTFGPSVERSIAMGYVPARHATPAAELAVEIRGRRVPCRVSKLPFYDRKGR